MAIMKEGQSLQRPEQNVLAEPLTVVGILGDENVGQCTLHQLKDDPVPVLEDEGLDAIDDSIAFVCLHERALV